MKLGLDWKFEGWKNTFQAQFKLPFGEGEQSKAFSGAFGQPVILTRGVEYQLDK